MSKLYKPLTIGLRHKNLQWINLQVGIHDLHCHCNEPLKHIILQIIEQEPELKFNKEESEQIRKCLTTTEDTTDALDAIGEGDLDALFTEDVFGDQEDTG